MKLVTKFNRKGSELIATVEDDGTGETFLIATVTIKNPKEITVTKPDGTKFQKDNRDVYVIKKDGEVVGEVLHKFLYYLIQYGLR
jgi:hypothetical protein